MRSGIKLRGQKKILTVEHGGGSVIVCGFFAALGPALLVIIDGIIRNPRRPEGQCLYVRP